jgi:hypothetical protein
MRLSTADSKACAKCSKRCHDAAPVESIRPVQSVASRVTSLPSLSSPWQGQKCQVSTKDTEVIRLFVILYMFGIVVFENINVVL